MYLLKLLSQLFHFSFFGGIQINDMRLFEVLSFKHAISTPLTILLASLDEVESTLPRSSNEKFKLYKASLLTIKQLSTEFSGTNFQHKNVDVVGVLSEVQELLGNSAMKIVKLCPGSYTLTDVNKTRLKEAVTCLVKNGTESGGTTPVVVTVLCMEQDEYLVLCIKDFGSGMSYWKKCLAQLPYISFKKNSSGIGLAFARQVFVKELQGTMTITSHVNTGTFIECRIPKQRPTYNQILAS